MGALILTPGESTPSPDETSAVVEAQEPAAAGIADPEPAAVGDNAMSPRGRLEHTERSQISPTAHGRDRQRGVFGAGHVEMA